MTECQYANLYKKVYALTYNTAPCRFDCGKLCGSACCKPLSVSEYDSGMQLLPYEKDYLMSLCGVTNGEYEFITNNGIDFLICHGKCDRKLRPFSCRIFPYFVNICGNTYHLRRDPRAAFICPLVSSNRYKRTNIRFLRSVKKAVRLLIDDSLIKADIEATSDFVHNILDLYKKL